MFYTYSYTLQYTEIRIAHWIVNLEVLDSNLSGKTTAIYWGVLSIPWAC